MRKGIACLAPARSTHSASDCCPSSARCSANWDTIGQPPRNWRGGARCGRTSSTGYGRTRKPCSLPPSTTFSRATPKGGGKSWRSGALREQFAEAVVAYEARHQGEFGFYRVVFTALVEADDPEIREAIRAMYRRFHERIRKLIETNREGDKRPPGLPADAAAWAVMGLATVSNIIRELELLRPRQREEMFAQTAKYLVQPSSR